MSIFHQTIEKRNTKITQKESVKYGSFKRKKIMETVFEKDLMADTLDKHLSLIHI